MVFIDLISSTPTQYAGTVDDLAWILLRQLCDAGDYVFVWPSPFRAHDFEYKRTNYSFLLGWLRFWILLRSPRLFFTTASWDKPNSYTRAHFFQVCCRMPDSSRFFNKKVYFCRGWFRKASRRWRRSWGRCVSLTLISSTCRQWHRLISRCTVQCSVSFTVIRCCWWWRCRQSYLPSNARGKRIRHREWLKTDFCLRLFEIIQSRNRPEKKPSCR